jgi:hypothetical protein
MRSWLVTTGSRAAVVLTVVILLLWLVALRPIQSAKNLAKEQNRAAVLDLAKLEKVKTTLATLPQVKAVKTQQISAFADFSNEINKSQEILNKLSISMPEHIKHVTGISLTSRSDIIAQTNQAVDQVNQSGVAKQINKDMQTAQKYINYEAAVSKVLNNILDYNPAADMSGFIPGSEDSLQRLSLAKEGLSKTELRIINLQGSYNDPTFREVVEQIRVLQSAERELEQNTDTKAWASFVAKAQSEIIANRQVFWNSESATLVSKLSKDKQQLSKTMRIWSNLEPKS